MYIYMCIYICVYNTIPHLCNSNYYYFLQFLFVEYTVAAFKGIYIFKHLICEITVINKVPFQSVTPSHVGWPTNWDLARETYPLRV